MRINDDLTSRNYQLGFVYGLQIYIQVLIWRKKHLLLQVLTQTGKLYRDWIFELENSLKDSIDKKPHGRKSFLPCKSGMLPTKFIEGVKNCLNCVSLALLFQCIVLTFVFRDFCILLSSQIMKMQTEYRFFTTLP